MLSKVYPRHRILRQIVNKSVQGNVVGEWDFVENFYHLSMVDRCCMNRYAEMVKKASSLARIAVAYDKNKNDPSITEAVVRETESLLGFILDNFNADLVDVGMLPDLYASETRESVVENHEDICGLAAGILPVSLMHELCSKYRLSFIPDECAHWSEFTESYKEVLLAI